MTFSNLSFIKLNVLLSCNMYYSMLSYQISTQRTKQVKIIPVLMMMRKIEHQTLLVQKAETNQKNEKKNGMILKLKIYKGIYATTTISPKDPTNTDRSYRKNPSQVSLRLPIRLNSTSLAYLSLPKFLALLFSWDCIQKELSSDR